LNHACWAVVSGLLLALVATVLLSCGAANGAGNKKCKKADAAAVEYSFVLDQSPSITPSDFDLMRNFLIGVINATRKYGSRASYAVVKFACETDLVTNMTSDADAAIAAVTAMGQYGYGTGLYDGLKNGSAQFTSSMTTKKVLILVTDGGPNDCGTGGNSCGNASLYKAFVSNTNNAGITRVAAAIVDPTWFNKPMIGCLDEFTAASLLQYIASDKPLYIPVHSFDDLFASTNKIVGVICDATHPSGSGEQVACMMAILWQDQKVA
jgi:hypothetical protein